MRIEVELPEQRVITLAGSAMQWGNVDGVGRDARFGGNPVPSFVDVAVDADGSVVVVNYYNPAIRRIAPDGTVTTIAGGTRGLRDGPADVAQFAGPDGVAIAPDGTIFVADRTNRRIRKIAPDGMVTTVAGSGTPDHKAYLLPTRDGPADEALFSAIGDIALAPDGDLYILDGHFIRRLSPSGWVSTFSGAGHGFRDGPLADARFGLLADLTVDASGNLYVLDNNPYMRDQPGRVATIRKISPGGVRTIYRDQLPAHDGGLLSHPSGLAVTSDGTIFLANTGHNQIVQLTPDGELRAIAGTGEAGSSDGPYAGATFSFPSALALAPSGALIVVDQAASTVRAILPGSDGFRGNVRLVDDKGLPYIEGVSSEIFAGRLGISGYSGDGGPAGRALFRVPWGLALDQAGNVLVADAQNHAIRRISADGTVTTLTGGNGKGALDGAPANAQFVYPDHVAVTAGGVVYVLEDSEDRIRRIASDGAVSTLEWDASGSIQTIEQGPDGDVLISREGEIWSLGSDGVLTLVGGRYGRMYGLGAHHDGSLYFLNRTSTNFRVKRLSTAGDVSTVFDDGVGIYGGPFGPHIQRLAVGSDGAVYVTDRAFGHVVRITRGGTAAIVVDHRTIGSARFRPEDILVTAEGDLLVSDPWQHVIWKITIDEDAGR